MNTTETMDPYPDFLRVVEQYLPIFVFVAGLLGNTLAIYAICRSPKLKTIPNFYILNLAVADIIYLATLPVYIHSVRSPAWIFGELPCKFYLSLGSVYILTKPIFMFLLSVNRYLTVCKPHIKPQSPVESRLLITGAWIFGAGLMIPIFIYSKVSRVIFEWESCWISNIDWLRIYYWQIWYPFGFGFAIPLILFLLLTIPVVMSKSNRSATTKMVLAINIVFFSAWAPQWIMQVAFALYPLEVASVSGINIILTCVTWFNWIPSVANPIVYASFSSDFRKSFKTAVTCKGFANSASESDMHPNRRAVPITTEDEAVALNSSKWTP